ncbi:hypothetical protein ABK040_007277 [Willaertia magna]
MSFKHTDNEIVKYVIENSVVETEEQEGIRKATIEKFPKFSKMVSSIDQMQLLKVLLKMKGVKNILEIGTFTGYSALTFALATNDTTKITCLDVSEEFTEIAKEFWKKANVDSRIELIIQPALESLKQLKEKNVEKFDFVYIDADKSNYSNYLDEVYDLLEQNALVVVDNTLWSGRVLDLNDQTNDTVAIREFNKKVKNDDRFDSAMATVGDGCTFLRKK